MRIGLKAVEFRRRLLVNALREPGAGNRRIGSVAPPVRAPGRTSGHCKARHTAVDDASVPRLAPLGARNRHPGSGFWRQLLKKKC
jgi:hypothetical protein